MDWRFKIDKEGLIVPATGLSEAQLQVLEAKLRVALARVQLMIMETRLNSPLSGVSLVGKAVMVPEDQEVTASAVLNVVEVAEILRIGRTKCYELVRTGQIPAIRVGKFWKVPRTALYEWMARASRTDGE